MTLKTRWLLIAGMLAIPYVVVAAAGFWWMYQHGWGLHWLVGTVVVSFLGGVLLRRTKSAAALPEMPVVGSNKWSPVGAAAWKKVETLAERVNPDDYPLDRPETLRPVLQEVFETVAREFHPKSGQPLLETPIPHVLRVVELVARDLRTACATHLPGAHVLTIRDLQRMQQLAEWSQALYKAYRVASFALNPVAAIARELNTYVTGEVLAASTTETKRWALQYGVKRAGYYAIELYSGRLVIEDVPFDPQTSNESRSDLSLEDRRDQALEAEPLRVLVLGQVKSGKSSLVNALFGEVRAAVDVVPRTAEVEPYLLERDGLQRAIILDTAGYEDPGRVKTALQQARNEFLRADLILMVVSAKTAARDSDRRFLDELRALFQSTPDKEFPPVVVPLTNIDQLRPFREWQPPYDLRNPDTPKAVQIRDAVEAVAQDLAVDPSRIVPVCLLPDRLYNVEEGLIPAILDSLPTAQRVKYLRCLRSHRDEQQWLQLRTQALNAGRLLWNTGRQLLDAAMR